MSKLNWTKQACFVFVLCAATTIALPAQTFTTLHSFDGTDGAFPEGALVQGTDGSLYGTTEAGGSGGCYPWACGTVFKLDTMGTLTSLYSFCQKSACTDGAFPVGSLVEAGGAFYGTTSSGGEYTCYFGSCGTVFTVTSDGEFSTLQSFDGANGEAPYDGMVEGMDGIFYGTTWDFYGTIFSLTFSGDLTALYDLTVGGGAKPWAGLIQGPNGNFYGTATQGGDGPCQNNEQGCGTVFEITPGGKFTTLHNFSGTDGESPYGGLIQAPDGNFYGTTEYGGASSKCNLGCGTVFKMTPSGTVTTLHSFCSQNNCSDGALPQGALVEATDGNYYGIAPFGGRYGTCNGGCGTVFRITPNGVFTVVHGFDGTDGEYPFAALIQGTDGNLYGTAEEGGSSGCLYGTCGTVFSLSVGLGPFVKTEPASAKVGKPINILGTDLTGATTVTFNGTAATFTVVSPSLITTTVPAGATSGKVQVVTPSGTLSSNVPFRVLP